MDYNQIIEKLKPNLQSIIDNFKSEIQKIRAGRLTGALIENIEVECFGQRLLLKQLGAISNPSFREICLQLWDKSYIDEVIRAIERENLGLSTRIEDNKIYLTSPPLSEETRKNLIQILNQKKEESFQEIRRVRDKAWREIQEGFKTGEIREDDKYRGKDKLEEVVREYREKLEDLVENKKKEIIG